MGTATGAIKLTLSVRFRGRREPSNLRGGDTLSDSSLAVVEGNAPKSGPQLNGTPV